MQKKKICFISLRNIYAITSLPKYKKCFGEHQFDIIYWDRHDIEENCGADTYYPMKSKISYKDSKRVKLKGYLSFIRHTLKVIKRNNYDKIIFLPTQTGILLYPFLKRKYSRKYIIDIRDYTAENNKLFYWLQSRIIKNSGLAIITSPGFNESLPKHDYLISHNTTYIPTSIINKYRNKDKSDSEEIVISCIGGIKFHNQFKKVIDSFKNDNRYILRFIGNGAEGLKEYCEQNNINNVELIGRFTPDKTIEYYMETDIIMNLYGNNNPLLDYALSNKLYYAATIGIPILVSPNTYMEEVSIGKGFGFSYDIEDKNIMKNKLYDYYKFMDWDSFYRNCDNFMQQVYLDEERFLSSVSNFIEES